MDSTVTPTNSILFHVPTDLPGLIFFGVDSIICQSIANRAVRTTDCTRFCLEIVVYSVHTRCMICTTVSIYFISLLLCSCFLSALPSDSVRCGVCERSGVYFSAESTTLAYSEHTFLLTDP